MWNQRAFFGSVLVLGCIGVLLGVANTPAWALGPGAPPVVRSVDVMVMTTDDGTPQLVAELEVEIPGGGVPLNVTSVTVTVPAPDGRTFTMPLDRVDLSPERSYFLNLSQAGVTGFPTGTYTFTVTDTVVCWDGPSPIQHVPGFDFA